MTNAEDNFKACVLELAFETLYQMKNKTFKNYKQYLHEFEKTLRSPALYIRLKAAMVKAHNEGFSLDELDALQGLTLFEAKDKLKTAFPQFAQYIEQMEV